MTVLIPVICWKTARKTAIPRGLRRRVANSSRSVPASCAIVSRISASSARAAPSPPTRVRTARASSSLSFLDEEARRLGDEEEGEEEREGGHGGRGEHPPPARRAAVGQRPVHEVREQDAGDDGHLVERDEAAADRLRRDLGDVEGGEDRGDADREAADEAGGHELGERARHRGADGRRGEQQRRGDQDPLAAEAVGEPARERRAGGAAEEERARRDLRAVRRELQVLAQEEEGAVDDRGVEAEEQSRDRGDRGDEVRVAAAHARFT